MVVDGDEVDGDVEKDGCGDEVDGDVEKDEVVDGGSVGLGSIS